MECGDFSPLSAGDLSPSSVSDVRCTLAQEQSRFPGIVET